MSKKNTLFKVPKVDVTSELKEAKTDLQIAITRIRLLLIIILLQGIYIWLPFKDFTKREVTFGDDVRVVSGFLKGCIGNAISFNGNLILVSFRSCKTANGKYEVITAELNSDSLEVIE